MEQIKDKFLTLKNLAEIEARAEKATPGPWECDFDNEEDYPSAIIEHRVSAENERGYRLVELIQLPYENSDDAVFITHARSDVPDLVKEVRRLRRLLQGNP